ncbi:probable glycosyltransferase At5g03795 [Tripterygium wilfordii]|uniref:probable glycosyltransferase At5g03795 n=1 Tax=Tripterygium wilfordii TaxID=458696 RepID=UPI0018F7E706|nr:probable glycosyltransferase At5g03795 [Tripterygium wilfordii]XP_038709462.1 probable glycosyltransferase At5g03795 [Tripterygium wilfordii]
MPSFVIILSVAVAISVIFFYPSLLPRIAFTTTNDQVNNPVQDSGIFEEVFQYPDVFLRNYALMEKGFKIFMYPITADDFLFYNETYIPGDHTTELIFYYSFISSERFHTNDGTKAHMFFIPINWSQIRKTGNYSYAENYVRRIINKYPYWNRSEGVDHFLVTSCDAGAIFSERVPLNNSIKVSCSASNDSRHHKHHHITLPQLRYPFVSPLSGYDIHHRTILIFWACKNSPASESDWVEYFEKFKESKYCICDGASYVTRICITDSIHFGCVPGERKFLEFVFNQLSNYFGAPFCSDLV